MSGESSTEYHSTTTVRISSESSGSTDFGESLLEYICPVSPYRISYYY